MDADGKSIVAWNQSAQRISADGSAIGTPIQLDTVNDNSVVEDISADPAGNFVVVWYLYYEVRGRCFQADGTPLGPDFALDDMGRGGESPAVEVAPDGSFVAVWVEQYYESGSGFDYQISARRFSSDCEPLGSTFTVNNLNTGDEATPDIAMDAAGNFMVVWAGLDKSGSGIFARRFDANGTPLGGQFRVNRRQSFSQLSPSVDMDDAGNAVIAFTSSVEKLPSGEFNDDVLIRRYAANGAPLGDLFSPHAPSRDVEYLPRVAVAPAGQFAVMWTVYTETNRDIWLQAYDAAGNANGPNQRVVGDEFDQYLGDLVAGSGETFLAVWPSHVAADNVQLYGWLSTFDNTPESHTFLPTNDAYVTQAKPQNVFGAKKVLQVKDAAKDVNSYVKFNVQSLSGTVQSATLRLYVTNPGPDGGAVYAVSPFYLNSSEFWLETALKWNNAPAIGGAPLDGVGNAAKGQWVELDVTAAVVAALGDNGRVSLAITNNSSNLVTYSSKEGAHPPELVVITN